MKIKIQINKKAIEDHVFGPGKIGSLLQSAIRTNVSCNSIRFVSSSSEELVKIDDTIYTVKIKNSDRKKVKEFDDAAYEAAIKASQNKKRNWRMILKPYK